jgi:hypothetical protein
MVRTKLGAAIAVVLMGLVALTGTAQAELSFDPASVSATFSSPQAGAHADFHTTFALTTDDIGQPTGSLGSLVMDLPRGFYANPTVTPKCSVEQVLSPTTALGECPMNTAVGVATALMFSVFGVSVRIDANVRTDGDYNVQAKIDNVAEGQPLISSDVTLWGVPADHQGPGAFTAYYGTSFGGPLSGTPRRPFLTNPSVCDGNPLRTTFRTTAWLDDVTPSYTAESPAQTGCDKQVFSPSLAVAPQSTEASVPSAYKVEIAVPQSNSPEGVGTPPLKDATVTLPEGTAISPSSADGLAACSDAQVGLKSKEPEQCPDASKIGTVEVDTPLLSEPLQGSVYLGTQQSTDPASGKMYRLFLVASGSGVRLKLEGSVKADPVTGKLTTTFADNPQLPFNKLTVAFKGGNRAALLNPPTCGPKTATATLTSWDGQTSELTSAYAIDQGCDKIARFEPSFDAGVSNPTAGGSSTFTMNMGRPDGQQDLGGVDVTLPPGLLGDVGSVALCAEAQAAAGTCGAGSRVGHTTAASGGGTQPLVVPQPGKAPTSVSLTGPYKGAPFGLSIVVPAQAGPFDLGTVVVRAALSIDRADGHVTVKSDPLPTIVGGVPLRLQKVNVTIDRQAFMVNGTDCSALRVGGQVRSAQGKAVDVGSRFQLGECASLAFAPKLALSVGSKGAAVASKAKARAATKSKAKARRAAVSGPVEMRDGGHPALSAHLEMDPNSANNQKATVALPLALALDPDNANGLCEPVDAAADKCPAASIVGSVSAVSPLLTGKVAGPVYFVRGERTDPKSGRIIRTLPRLFVPLTASDYPGVKIDLHASSDVVDERLVTTFDNLPDVPISSFDLKIDGGAHGILVVSNTNMCDSTQYNDNAFTAQSNKRYSTRTGIATACPLAIVKSSRSGGALNLTVGGLAPGKVTVTGKGLSKKTKTIPVAKPLVDDDSGVTVSATTHTSVAVPLSKEVRRSLAGGHNIKVKVTVAFRAQGAAKTTKTTKTLTIHGTKKK